MQIIKADITNEQYKNRNYAKQTVTILIIWNNFGSHSSVL